METNNPRVILDNGSGYLKCGMSNQNIPQHSLPALIGRPMLRYEESIEDFQIKVIDIKYLNLNIIGIYFLKQGYFTLFIYQG